MATFQYMFPAPTLLEESEALHKAALQLSMMAFGEKNVQTAKHYGNLGRLYQSMQKFQVLKHFLLSLSVFFPWYQVQS